MSKLRLLKAAAPYQPYLDACHRDEPGLSGLDYEAQRRWFETDFFGGAGVWRHALEMDGGFEVWEVLVNAESMQKAWAREHRVSIAEDRWLPEIFVAQCREFKPDVIFALASGQLTPALLSGLKREMPGLRVVSFDGIGLNRPDRFAATDLMLSCLEFMLEPYAKAGMRTALLPHGFNPKILEGLVSGGRKLGATFLGALDLSQNGHHARLELLDRVVRSCPLKLSLQVGDPFLHLLSGAKRAVLAGSPRKLGSVFSEYPKLRRLKHQAGPAVYGRKMFQTLADSRLTINTHIDAAGPHAANMRLFEATGVGTCLLTDWKPNLSSLFEVDREVVAYRSAEECVEKILHLLDHPRDCEAIGQAGQRRTLKEHNAIQQVREIAPLLRSLAE